MNDMANKDLQQHYVEGHTYTSSGDEERAAILRYLPDEPQKILEVGCGRGMLARMMRDLGHDVTAIDYADQNESEDGLTFLHGDYRELEGECDVVVMMGVLEHMDEPLECLRHLKEAHHPKQIITSSPAFLNPRGHVWMALHLLLGVPMSLTDLHFISPFDMSEWAKELGAQMDYVSVDQDWGHGQRLIADFEKRLPNALSDKGLVGDVNRYLDWLRKTLDYQSYNDFSGATIVYNLQFGE